MSPAISICVAALIGAPYSDTQGRFSLDLPEGWGLAPRFGETDGMRFSRRLPSRRGGREVHLEVLVRQLDPSSWADASAGELSAQGYALKRGTGRVAGRQAVRMRARRGRDQIRCHFLGTPDLSFRLCVEGRRSDSRVLEAELKAILHSFRPSSAGAGASRRPPPSPPPSAPPPAASANVELVGRFEGVGGVTLVLDADGSYALGPSQGRYLAQDGLLILVPSSGRRTRFRYALEGGDLVLSSPALERPAVYRRVRPTAPGDLVGTWKRGAVVLELSADHGFELGSHRGKWVYEEGTLRLRHEKGDIVSYSAVLSQDDLRLSGADLDGAVTLRRQR